MKTLHRVICVLAVMGGLPAASLFGTQFDYAGTPPVGSGAGDAAVDTFTSGGQMTSTELSQQFAPEPSAPVSSGGTTATVAKSSTASSGTQQQMGVDVGGGSFEVNGKKGTLYTVNVPYSRKLNERGTLELALPLTAVTYDNALGLKDAHGYGIGLNAGYAWQAFLKKDNVPYRWKITPSTGLYYRDSSDLKEGAWVINAGLSSSFAWQFSPGWVVNVGNSVSFAWNNGIKNYPDPIRDNQQTLKNGVQIYRMLDRWTFAAYVTDTEALNDAVVDSYQTYGICVGFKLTKNRSVKATLLHEEGNSGYKSVRGTIGTTWQF